MFEKDLKHSKDGTKWLSCFALNEETVPCCSALLSCYQQLLLKTCHRSFNDLLKLTTKLRKDADIPTCK